MKAFAVQNIIIIWNFEDRIRYAFHFGVGICTVAVNCHRLKFPLARDSRLRLLVTVLYTYVCLSAADGIPSVRLVRSYLST